MDAVHAQPQSGADALGPGHLCLWLLLPRGLGHLKVAKSLSTDWSGKVGQCPHRLDLLKGEAQALRVLRPLEAGEHACEWKALSAQQYGAG